MSGAAARTGKFIGKENKKTIKVRNLMAVRKMAAQNKISRKVDYTEFIGIIGSQMKNPACHVIRGLYK